jgi:hypothetical protein
MPGAGRETALKSTTGIQWFITHRFGLAEMDEAYDVFAHPADSGALKVVLFS